MSSGRTAQTLYMSREVVGYDTLFGLLTLISPG